MAWSPSKEIQRPEVRQECGLSLLHSKSRVIIDPFVASQGSILVVFIGVYGSHYTAGV
jgi:hypothetical protein